MVSTPADLVKRHGLLLALAAITTARLAVAAAMPLTDDEAYYALWASHLQAGYFDHPPMIAWFIRAGESLAGPSPLGVRLVPVLAIGASGALLADLARHLGLGPGGAGRAALWFNGALLIALGGVLAVPDSPTLLFWTAALACAARAIRAAAPFGWWLAAGAAAGLACLSKYSGLFLAPGLLLWLAASRDGRRALATPGPWAAALIAGALFGINVAWNAGHGWVTFAKQFGRAVPEGFAPQHLAGLIAAQVLLANPVIALLAARAAGPACGEGRRMAQPNLWLPLASSAPFALYLLLHSLHAAVQGQWPAPLYPALALLAAAGVRDLGKRTRQGADLTVGTTAGLAVALGVVHVLAPATDWAGPRDPVSMVRGWPEFAGRLRRLGQDEGAAWYGVLSYQTKAQLQLAIGDAPVVQLGERARYGPADASWRADLSRPGLVVETLRRTDPTRLRRCFQMVTPLGRLWRGERAGAAYQAFRVAGPRGDLLREGCE